MFCQLSSSILMDPLQVTADVQRQVTTHAFCDVNSHNCNSSSVAS